MKEIQKIKRKLKNANMYRGYKEVIFKSKMFMPLFF